MHRAQDCPSSMIRRFSVFKVAAIALCMASVAGVGAVAQEQTQSVADAARRAREQKKQTTTSGKVWTNENVPTTGDGVNVVGEAPAAVADADKSAEAGSNDKSNTASAPAKSMSAEEIAKRRADLMAQMEEARKDQDRLEKELDLAKRDLDLQTQQAYTNPMALSNSAAVEGQIQPYRDAMNSKADELDKAKAKIADLQKQLDELQQQTPGTTPSQQ